jgi:hypothetical protein
MGSPFARSFLFDWTSPPRHCVKRSLAKIEELRKAQDGIVELLNEFTEYAFDGLSLRDLFCKGCQSSRVRIRGALQRYRDRD